MTGIVDPAPSPSLGSVVLPARPEGVRLSASDTAVIVIDMQNAYASVARMLDEMATVPNTGGVLLTFDDFLEGVEAFGTRIQPLMESRKAVSA